VFYGTGKRSRLTALAYPKIQKATRIIKKIYNKLFLYG